MRKVVLFVSLMLILAMGVLAVRADDNATPEPGTPADNECYPGGVLYREENQDGCPTLWYWKAGWFLARFNRGLISRADFPKEFESVLPPEDDARSCWHGHAGPITVSILYIGPANQKGNIIAYMSSDCNGTPAPNPGGKSFVVFANNPTDAKALCSAQGTVNFLQPLNSIGYLDAPSNAWGCTVL